MVLEDDLVLEAGEEDIQKVGLIQLAFRARLVRKAVRKLSQNALRKTQPFYTSPELLETLTTPSAERNAEELDHLLHVFHHLPFFEKLSELQQAQCCRVIGVVAKNKGDTVYAQGERGDVFYIVLQGGVTIEADGGRAALGLGIGDSFGHTELLGGEGCDGTRKATATASSKTFLATLERKHYLKITGVLEEEVIQILGRPSQGRTDEDIAIVQSLFSETPFFRALHYRMLQNVCCKHMTLRSVPEGEMLFSAGDEGHEYFVTVRGQVEVLVQGEDERGKAAGYQREERKKKQRIILKAGSSFGEIAITSTDPKDWTRSAGIACLADCTFAVLSRERFLESTSAIEGRVYAALETEAEQRSELQIGLLMEYFRDQAFFNGLALEGLRRQACSMMFRENAAAGDVLWSDGDTDAETFHILLRGGPIREVKEGETVRTLRMGDELGGDAFSLGGSAHLVRTSTMIVDDDCVLATFTKDDYQRIFVVDSVMDWIRQFWDLITMEAFGHKPEDNHHDKIDFKAYAEFHGRVSKTIHEKGSFSAAQEARDALEDWKEDLERAHANIIHKDAKVRPKPSEDSSPQPCSLLALICGFCRRCHAHPRALGAACRAES